MSNITIDNKLAIERGQRLRFLRDIVGMTLKNFAGVCTIGQTTLIYWEKGVNILTERGAQKVVRAVRDEGVACTLVWLLGGIGDPPTIFDQSKLSKLHYPSPFSVSNHAVHEALMTYTTESEFQKEITLFKQLGPKYLVYTILDGSMHPIYQAGDCVGGYVLEKNTLELSNRKDCIILLEDGNYLVRRVKLENLHINKLSLYVINAEASVDHPPLCHLPISTISALAPIIRVWKKGVH